MNDCFVHPSCVVTHVVVDVWSSGGIIVVCGWCVVGLGRAAVIDSYAGFNIDLNINVCAVRRLIVAYVGFSTDLGVIVYGL